MTSNIKPFYQDQLVELYHGNCLDFLDILMRADVMVTDPPYGISYKSERVPLRSVQPIAGDGSVEVRDEVLSAWGEKPALVFGKWSKPRPEGTRQRLIWSKHPDPGMGDLGMPWGNSDEEVYVLGRGWTGKRGSNILTYPKPSLSDRYGHPTPKPVALMEALIAKCPDGIIVDPFAGSGSTLRAAKNLGRRAVGFEIEEEYCATAARRLSQEVLFA